MPDSPLQDRITELCVEAVASDNPADFERVVSDLRTALREQLNHLRNMVDDAKLAIAQRTSEPFPERRRGQRRKTDRRRLARGNDGMRSIAKPQSA